MFGTAVLSARKRFFFLPLLSCVALLSGCDQSASQANGECYYETVTTNAEVIGLKPHPEGNGRISVILDFKASILALEDQEMGELKDVNIDHDFLVRNHVEIGNKYEVSVTELVRGDCKTKLTVAFMHDLE